MYPYVIKQFISDIYTYEVFWNIGRNPSTRCYKTVNETMMTSLMGRQNAAIQTINPTGYQGQTGPDIPKRSTS